VWARALLAVDRATQRAASVVGSLRDEALLAWIRVEDRSSVTAELYAGLPTYLPGGSRYKEGLFVWEDRVVSSPRFPRSGRVLVGAAGAGRELAALVERGYEVVAFDPCLPFVEAASRVIPPGKAVMVQASYDDLVAFVTRGESGGGGELAPVLRGKRFDAAVLGWGSLSHVMPAYARKELLQAVRALVPEGPLLASFVLAETGPFPNGKGRLQKGLRRLFALAGAPGSSEDHDHFATVNGFFAFLTREEVRRLAAETGYEVALLEDYPYPHALLLPV
jgi:hypothetical protein